MADTITLHNVKVGRDGVHLKTSNSGKDYAQFVALWSSSRKDRAGQREYGPTKYVTVNVFGFEAQDLAASVTANDYLDITGTIEHFTWQSDNGPRDSWTIFADRVTRPLPRAQQHQQQPHNNAWGTAPSTGGFGAQEDVPF